MKLAIFWKKQSLEIHDVKKRTIVETVDKLTDEQRWNFHLVDEEDMPIPGDNECWKNIRKTWAIMVSDCALYNLLVDIQKQKITEGKI